MPFVAIFISLYYCVCVPFFVYYALEELDNTPPKKPQVSQKPLVFYPPENTLSKVKPKLSPPEEGWDIV